ncbi:hypothetical protein [Glycomyces paridis]|uniref:Secreted protein n=1 Tax=Glycomyces paridis TaxID=2126555 RepID=A0A4S8PJD7_9ACTN|nr:hypothetical protein [Glycomyces paridis]THV30111.1 hypothetical protein E9998_06955 [Glycomyces paridis]
MKRMLGLLTVAATVAAVLLTTAPAQAQTRGDTADGQCWQITVKGDNYGEMCWDDYLGGSDADVMYLHDNWFDGTSTRMTVCRASFCESVHAYGGDELIAVPRFHSGDTFEVQGCGWDEGDEKGCTDWITVTE